MGGRNLGGQKGPAADRSAGVCMGGVCMWVCGCCVWVVCVGGVGGGNLGEQEGTGGANCPAGG